MATDKPMDWREPAHLRRAQDAEQQPQGWNYKYYKTSNFEDGSHRVQEVSQSEPSDFVLVFHGNRCLGRVDLPVKWNQNTMLIAALAQKHLRQSTVVPTELEAFAHELLANKT